MAAEIAGLICAAYIAKANSDMSAALQYQETAQAWASEVDDLAYTTTGSYGNGDYLLRITPDGQPNAGTDTSATTARRRRSSRRSAHNWFGAGNGNSSIAANGR